MMAMEVVVLAVLISVLMVAGGAVLYRVTTPLLALVFWAICGALLLWIIGNRRRWSPGTVAGVLFGLLLLSATVVWAILFL